jgi:hypothetical protein
MSPANALRHRIRRTLRRARFQEAKKLSKISQKLAQNWSKNCQKMSKNCQKLAKNWPKIGQKLTQNWPKIGLCFLNMSFILLYYTLFFVFS